VAEIRIYGGTAKGTKSLCEDCVFASIIKGFRESEKIILCGMITSLDSISRAPIPFAVAECGDYLRKGTPTKSDMEKIAIPIDGTHTKVKGFKD
jgi:hypothetical protein